MSLPALRGSGGRVALVLACGGALAVVVMWVLTAAPLISARFMFDGYGPVAEDLRAFTVAASAIADGHASAMYDGGLVGPLSITAAAR